MKKSKLIIPVIFASMIMSGCTPKYTPPHYDDKDYGYMLNTFYSVNGSLRIEKDSATIVEGEVEKKLYPTEIKQEEISHDIETYDENDQKITKTVTESVYAIYYGKQRNDDDYRITLTASELKFISLEKKVGEEYERISLFTPAAPYLAGAYNGYDEFEFSPYNNVIVIGSELKSFKGADLPGYQMNTYHSGSYMDTQTIVVPGIYLNGNEVVIAADLLDLSDGEYYGFTFYPHQNGNLYNILEGKFYSGYYADPTMFLTTIYDEEGNVYVNDYATIYDEETYYSKGITAYIGGDEADFMKYRDVDGVHYVFTKDDGTEIEVSSSVNNFKFTVGEEEHSYAPQSTAFELTYVEENFVTGDFDNSVTMYFDIDWDTWEDIPVYKYNGQDVTNLKVAADSDGRVVTSFTAEGKTHKLKKVNSIIGTLETDGNKEYVFNESYFSDAFNNSFINPGEGITVEVENFNYKINSSEPAKGELFLDEELDTVGFKMGDFSLYAVNSEEGIYIILHGEEGAFLMPNDNYQALLGTYTCDGEQTVTFENGKVLINGQNMPFTFGTVLLESSYKIAFIIGNYCLIPDFAGTVNLYGATSDGTLLYLTSYISDSVFASFIGTYCYLGENGVENIKFTSDGKFLLDTVSEEGLERDVEYPYMFTSDGKRFTINAIVETPQGNAAVPFVKAGYALVLEEANLFYIDSRLFELQAAYGDGTNNTIFIMEDQIYINNAVQTITNLSKENNVTTITTKTHVITATVDGEGNHVLKSRKVNEDDSAAITYTDMNVKLAHSKGVKFVADADNYFQVESYYASLTNSISLKTTKNGAMFSNSVYAVYNNGQLALRAAMPLGTYNLYYDGDYPVAAKVA